MAKKDRLDDEEVETQDAQPEENAMAKKDDESESAAASTEGLVKMSKSGESLHVHPTTVKAHKEAGWELA